jgi:hypothetical protein
MYRRIDENASNVVLSMEIAGGYGHVDARAGDRQAAANLRLCRGNSWHFVRCVALRAGQRVAVCPWAEREPHWL